MWGTGCLLRWWENLWLESCKFLPLPVDLAWCFACNCSALQLKTQNITDQNCTFAHLLQRHGCAWHAALCQVITQHSGLPSNIWRSGLAICSIHPLPRNYFGSSIKQSLPGCVLLLFWSLDSSLSDKPEASSCTPNLLAQRFLSGPYASSSPRSLPSDYSLTFSSNG